ncbi:NAD(P)H-dependent glycerol-3-phosphate dehydrogenase [Salsipaludibacter albus]|uniref:NAD(P)H-dependent glycerol-3-phosphate dehydrogenase n=1 Tax=Salsipaludibacter albus TaxID=2849650 RepID=UPI001EE3EE34|nr:NAD(P)H-dependent glycerol-3-phosphate dehydrogenase [Salsipaludibacter albus]MBY5162361.1 NAD(P)-dependent glycerol-3-phosphate dehydrogenase [Salsipaludibacter albus]
MGRTAVMGAGSWGTAYALMCHDAGEDVVVWARRPEVAEEINVERTNRAYLPDAELPPLRATADPEEALDRADVVVLAVPSIGISDQLAAWGHAVPDRASLASLIKGVDVETRRFGSEVIADGIGGDPDRIVVVSGPNLAKECAQRLPAATVAASPSIDHARRVQQAAHAPYFRVYTNPDRIGVEVGGAVKNVVALAAGIAHGMGFGDNTMATVITRGLAEMQRLGVALGGEALTFGGLAGVGDLVATCTSPKSRNRTVGTRLGTGESLDDVIASMNMVAEGVKSSRAIVALAREQEVEMPIAEAVVAILHEGLDARDAIKALLARSAKPEIYGLD